MHQLLRFRLILSRAIKFSNPVNFNFSECEDGWKKFGDSCYKNLGTGNQKQMKVRPRKNL